MVKAYRSCFIVDVQVSPEAIQIMDSGRNKFFISLKDKGAVESFREWFKNVFLKSKSQCVSIFQYEMRPEEKDSEIEEAHIVKFIMQNLDPIASEEAQS